MESTREANLVTHPKDGECESGNLFGRTDRERYPGGATRADPIIKQELKIPWTKMND